MPTLSSVPDDVDCLYRFDSEGKSASMESVGSGVVSLGRGGARSMYSDRVFISHITGNPSIGEDKVRVKPFVAK